MARRSSAAALVVLAVGAGAGEGQGVDTAAALGALRDASAACRADGGRSWGRSLCGPIALMDRSSRLVLATDTVAGRAFLPYGGAFVAVAPGDVPLANTSFRWGERSWALVLLPLPRNRFDRVRLLLHESFHREQAALGLAPGDRLSPHLDEREGRVWLRMELRALAAALEATGAAARPYVEDAVAFRAQRYALFPGADALEAALELHEGLAEYTGTVLALGLVGEGDGLSRVVERVKAGEGERTYVRSFAYATGPALGLLLDRFAPTWRDSVRTERGLTGLIRRAIGFTPARSLARDVERRGSRYGLEAVRREETQRATERTQRVSAYRARFIDGPALVLTQSSLGTSFDPNELVPLGEAGTVYPTGTFTAAWGRLVVKSGGALISPDFTRVVVAAPAEPPTGATVVGDGWTLELATGWVVQASPTWSGSYEVTRR